MLQAVPILAEPVSLNTKLVPTNGNENFSVRKYSFLTSSIERTEHLRGQITTPRGVKRIYT